MERIKQKEKRSTGSFIVLGPIRIVCPTSGHYDGSPNFIHEQVAGLARDHVVEVVASSYLCAGTF